MPIVEGSEPELEAGKSSARRKPVWLLKTEASEIVTSTGVVLFLSNLAKLEE